MSKTQALLASNGALMPPGSRGERAPYVGLVGHYATGERNFDAALLFDDGDDLVRVVLTQRTPRECAGTLAALQDKYGQAQNLATLRRDAAGVERRCRRQPHPLRRHAAACRAQRHRRGRRLRAELCTAVGRRRRSLSAAPRRLCGVAETRRHAC